MAHTLGSQGAALSHCLAAATQAPANPKHALRSTQRSTCLYHSCPAWRSMRCGSSGSERPCASRTTKQAACSGHGRRTTKRLTALSLGTSTPDASQRTCARALPRQRLGVFISFMVLRFDRAWRRGAPACAHCHVSRLVADEPRCCQMPLSWVGHTHAR